MASRVVDLRASGTTPGTPDAIHDLRVGTRRLQTMVRLLPKDIRASNKFEKFQASLDSTIKATSEIRDSDVVIVTVGELVSPASEVLAHLLSKRRNSERTVAKALAGLSAPKIPTFETGSVTSQDLGKGLRKEIRRRRKKVEGLLSKAVSDSSNVKELHALRKEVKKLRYLRELQRGESGRAKALAEWQENIGKIHDLDIALIAVNEANLPGSKEVAKRLHRDRNSRYRAFVKGVRKDGLSGT